MSGAPFGCPAWRGREAATTRAGEQHGAAVERSRNPQESERGQACERKCGRIGMRYAFRELDQTIRAHRDQLCPATRIDVGDHPRSDGRTAAVCARGDHRPRDVLAGAPACGLALEQERLTSVDRDACTAMTASSRLGVGASTSIISIAGASSRATANAFMVGTV